MLHAFVDNNMENMGELQNQIAMWNVTEMKGKYVEVITEIVSIRVRVSLMLFFFQIFFSAHCFKKEIKPFCNYPIIDIP